MMMMMKTLFPLTVICLVFVAATAFVPSSPSTASRLTPSCPAVVVTVEPPYFASFARASTSRIFYVSSSSSSLSSSLSLSSTDETTDNNGSSQKEDDEKPEDESEVEKLLRKARELRAQAQEAEERVHAQATVKRETKTAQVDALVEELLSSSSNARHHHHDDDESESTSDIGDRLRTKRVSREALERVVDRLDDRILIAEGYDHVDPTTFQRRATNSPKDVALARSLQRQLDALLDAVQVMDEEFRKAHASTATGSDEFGLYSTTSTELEHWGGGNLASELKARLSEKQRERADQFQKRMSEINEAQRVKQPDNRKPPPPKAKDDHGFL